MASPPRARGVRSVAGLVITLSLMGFPAHASAQTADDLSDDIAAKQREAARIADEVEGLGATASIALEEYRQGQVRLEEADATLFEARRRVEELRQQYDATRELADDRLAAMYRGQNAPNPMSYLDAVNAQDLGSRQHYASIVADRDRSALTSLRTRRDDLTAEERRVETQRDEVAAQTAALKAQKVEVEGLMASRQAALDQAQGELAAIVAEEQSRRQAEQEARLREEQRRRAEADARRRTEEEARRATSTTTAPAANATPTTASPATTPTTAPAAPSAPPPGVHPRAGEAVQTAMDKLGTPYQWGGNGPDSYDCSGLTTYAWASVGVKLPRSSGMQKAALPPVGMDQLAPGDLLFYGSPVHHVGMFIGDGKMVNAPFTGDRVRIDSIYRKDFAGAGRPG